MDDQDLTEEQVMLSQTTAKFIQSELPISKIRALHDHSFGSEGYSPEGFDREWLGRTAELGWYSMLIPEEHGGGSITGHGLLDLTAIADSIGRYLQPGPFLSTNVVASAISHFGSPDQQKTLLAGIAAGEVVATWAPFGAAGEWDSGAGLEIVVDGDDILLRGSRGFVPDAAGADHILVTGRSEDLVLQVLVPASTPGVEIEPLISFDITRRLAAVSFDGARLPVSAVLGGEIVSATAAVEHQLQTAIVLACAEAVGALDAVFDMTVEYSKDRIAFGRPIGSFQALKHAMADQLLHLESCKAAAVEAALAVDSGNDDAAEIVSMAAAYLDEYATRIVQQSLQIHGGIGFTWEHDLHLYMRRIRAVTSMWCERAWHYDRIREVCAL
ncbi:MAG: acyl-CoA dehydrogenase family protein [Actinomycetota bacterium]